MWNTTLLSCLLLSFSLSSCSLLDKAKEECPQQYERIKKEVEKFVAECRAT